MPSTLLALAASFAPFASLVLFGARASAQCRSERYRFAKF